MYGVRHHLINDFPEFAGTIDELKNTDKQFARLFEQYHETDEKISGYQDLDEPATDLYMEQLKKWRVRLKDELYHMLRQKTQPVTH